MAVPIYISPNGLGIPVVISTNGYGLPVVIVSGELPDPVAPEITTAASISGSTDPDGLLTLTPGASSGSPPPSRVIAWLHQGSVLDGETGLTLDKDGRIGAFQARVTWTNSAGNAVSTSNTITTEAIPTPTLTATLSPNPPIAGEVLTITFSADPDAVTVMLDGTPVAGTLVGAVWTSDAPLGAGDDLTIDADADGYTAYSVSVEVQPAEVEPENPLQIVAQPDSTFAAVVDDTEPFDITVTEPAYHAGTYTVDPADVQGQPPYWVVGVSAPASIDASQVVNAVPGFPISDAAGGDLITAFEWRDESGDPIPGLIGLDLTLEDTTALEGQTITLAHIATNSFGSSETTAMVEVGDYQAQPDTFSAPDGTLIEAYVGESGIAWNAAGATITNGRLRTTASGSYYVQERLDDLSADQFAEATFVIGSAPSDAGIGLVVRGDKATRTGYYLRRNAASWIVGAISGGTVSGVVGIAKAQTAEEEVSARIEVSGTSSLRVIVGGEVIYDQAHATIFASGKPGILNRGTNGAGVGTEISTFHAGEL